MAASPQRARWRRMIAGSGGAERVAIADSVWSAADLLRAGARSGTRAV